MCVLRNQTDGPEKGGQYVGLSVLGAFWEPNFSLRNRFCTKLSVLEKNICLSKPGPKGKNTAWQKTKIKVVYQLLAVNAFSLFLLVYSKMSYLSEVTSIISCHRSKEEGR